MPVLHVRRNVHHITGLEFLSRLAFLLIPAPPSYSYEYLAASLFRVVDVPLVIASRLERYVEDTYLLSRERVQVAPACEVFPCYGVGSPCRNNRAESSSP